VSVEPPRASRLRGVRSCRSDTPAGIRARVNSARRVAGRRVLYHSCLETGKVFRPPRVRPAQTSRFVDRSI